MWLLVLLEKTSDRGGPGHVVRLGARQETVQERTIPPEKSLGRRFDWKV